MKINAITILLAFSMILVSISGCLEFGRSHYMVHFYLCNDNVNFALNMTLMIDGEDEITEEIPTGSMGITGHKIVDIELSNGNHYLEVFVDERNLSGNKTVNIDEELWILIIPHEEDIMFDIWKYEPGFM